MKTKKMIAAAGCVGIALTLGLGHLAAQAPVGQPAAHDMTGAGMAPQQSREMMKKMGMSEAMMTRCQLMGNVQVSAYDPAAVLAMSQDLKLTSEQTKDLEAILATAQGQVKAKLNPEQLALLLPIASTPASMAGLCQAMHKMTGKEMKCMMMCPMPSTADSDGKKPQKAGMVCCPMMGP